MTDLPKVRAPLIICRDEHRLVVNLTSTRAALVMKELASRSERKALVELGPSERETEV